MSYIFCEKDSVETLKPSYERKKRGSINFFHYSIEDVFSTELMDNKKEILVSIVSQMASNACCL